MKFAILGAAGFIARRHFETIYALNHEVVLAHDPASNVGFMDEYSNKIFFTQSERLFWDAAETMDAMVVICSPNNFHAQQIAEANLRGLPVICEKPLCLSEPQLWSLKHINANVYPIMQLRYSNAEKELARIAALPGKKWIALDYVAPRGRWFSNTWKGFTPTSGGILLNIGIHAFDMIARHFGQPTWACLRPDGTIDAQLGLHHLTARISTQGKACREIKVTADEQGGIKSTVIFTGEMNLHHKAYEAILSGKGLRLEDAEPGLRFVWGLQKLGVAL